MCEYLPPIVRLSDLNGGSDAIGEGAGELDTALDIRAVVGIMIAAAACGSPVSRCANKCFRRSAHDGKLKTKERSILSGHAHPRAEWPWSKNASSDQPNGALLMWLCASCINACQ